MTQRDKNRHRPFTVSDLEYICRFYESDGPKMIALALDRTPTAIQTKVCMLKKQGLFEVYKNMNRYWL